MDNRLNLVVNFAEKGLAQLNGGLKNLVGLGKSGSRALRDMAREGGSLKRQLADVRRELAGASGNGDLATSVGAPVEELPSAKEFVANYKAAGYKEAYEAYGGYSYDSAWAIIEAVKKVVGDNDGKLPDDARAKVTEAMQNVSFDGVTGKVSFDEFGDATNKQLTVYTVKGGDWATVKSGTFTG